MAGQDTTRLQPGISLTSASNLLLHTRASGYVAVSGSGSWSAAADIQLGSAVRLSGTGSTFIVSADSDGSGSGSLLFASTSNITVDSASYSTIDLKYHDVAWSPGFLLSAFNADVVFDKSTNLSPAGFGGSAEVSSAELQMVTTTGMLQFGNVNSGDIRVEGMDRSSNLESLVLIKSLGAVSFDTGVTKIPTTWTFEAPVRLRSLKT